VFRYDATNIARSGALPRVHKTDRARETGSGESASEAFAGALERAPHPAADAATMGSRIATEQIRMLYRPVAPLAVNLVNAAVFVAIFWPRLPRLAVVLWTSGVVAVMAGRWTLRHQFWRHAGDAPRAGWARAYAVAAGLTGALWGASAVTVPFVDAPVYHMLVGLTAAGMCAGAVASLSMHLPSCYAFIFACLIPVAGAFLAVDDAPYRGLGAMAIVFAAALTLIARGSHAALVDTLKLRFDNADLVRELSVARDMADQAGRSNSETLAHLSHELRTPLNAIGGFAEIMRRQIFGPLGHAKYEEYANDIGDSASHLTDLVEEILLYTRGNTGTLRLEEAIVDVAAEIDGCMQMIWPAARDGRVELSAQVASDLPLLRADQVKLRQMLVNLMSNAVKFTPRGGHVTVIARIDALNAITVAVADTGIGIDIADQPRVLQPYVQLESAFVRKRQSGLGLGLPIVKRLIELHGGTLGLDSTPGVGTTVTLRFPPARFETRPGSETGT
jgi:two-component system, cell cycle sensor histidine kinase PleC